MTTTMIDDVTVTDTAPEPTAARPGVRPRWERPALAALLILTAALYLWSLGSLGYGNQFYAAAVQAGTQDLRAWLFGSLDSANAITVDKPPASIWVMAAAGRIFGFNSWSMLVPQALMGVGSVGLLYAAVRRTNGPAAGLLAGTVLALTPVAALMFRYNNPDALLVLLLVVAAYAVVRAIDTNPTRWVALSGVALGFAFLTKLMQAFLVIPALAVVVLVATAGGVWTRVRNLLIGLAAMIASAGWYLLLVQRWPADARPYIGGSTDNSLLELAIGYNGLGRVLGGSGNPTRTPGGSGGPGGPGGAAFGGDPGFTRMFGEAFGNEISWLLPAAVIGLIAGAWFTRREMRTDRTRAALLLWGGWMVVTAGVLSYMKGIVHPYYTIALAPGVAGVIGVAVVELWRGRAYFASRLVLGLMLAATGVWSFVLLDRTPDWLPWLRWTVLVGAIAVAAVLIVGLDRRRSAALAVAGLLLGVAPTAAYTLETVIAAHSGGLPTSGSARGGSAMPRPPGGGQDQDTTALEHLLTSTQTRWAAATVGSHTAGDLELKTGAAIMAIGGFSGGDDAPTPEQFQRYVADGQIRYFLVGQGFGGRKGPGGFRGGTDSAGNQISAWVKDNFASQTVDGVTVYDLQG